MIARVCLALLAIVLTCAPAAKADALAVDSLDALFAVLGHSPGLYAKFHEEKQIALLVAPLKSDGTLHFDKIRGLARHTLSPQKQSILLASGTLTIWDGTKTETVSLKSSAPLRALAEAFSMMLAADRAGIERSFKPVFVAEGGGAWRLRLEPMSKELKSLVSGIDVAGQGAVVKSLRVAEASGDVSTTTFADVDTNKRYSEAEARAVFKVP
jgi:hypothetical protein